MNKDVFVKLFGTKLYEETEMECMSIEDLLIYVDELLNEKNELEDKLYDTQVQLEELQHDFEEYKDEIEDNYQRIDAASQYEVYDRDFI